MIDQPLRIGELGVRPLPVLVRVVRGALCRIGRSRQAGKRPFQLRDPGLASVGFVVGLRVFDDPRILDRRLIRAAGSFIIEWSRPRS